MITDILVLLHSWSRFTVHAGEAQVRLPDVISLCSGV
jgi:hypothetical protein